MLFPDMHAQFSMGNFTVKHAKRSAISLPFDQALEMVYNKPKKGRSGLIGITKKKEPVLKWNILKNMKMKYTNFLYDVFSMSDDGVVIIIIAQLHSAKFELRFCTGSKPDRGVSEICDGENL